MVKCQRAKEELSTMVIPLMKISQSNVSWWSFACCSEVSEHMIWPVFYFQPKMTLLPALFPWLLSSQLCHGSFSCSFIYPISFLSPCTSCSILSQTLSFCGYICGSLPFSVATFLPFSSFTICLPAVPVWTSG